MNVSRFQVCLNHDDPEIVKKGLDEFVTHILQDHDATLTFGYNGRPPNLDSTYWSTASPVINGTLSSYIRSSPRCDELFVLWSLPTRDLDKELCSSHMTCLAAILHCARANANFSTTIVQRILRDHLKSVHMQLGSGHTSLVHATLGLLLTVARTTTQNCRDLYQKLSLQSAAFLQLAQRGKAVMWQHRDWQGEDIATDARLLIALMVFSFMKNADDSIFGDLITHTSLVKRILSSIHKDPNHTIRIVLDTVVFLQREAPWCHKQSQLMLVESKHQQTLMPLYSNADMSVQESVHRFFVDYCTVLAAALHSDGGGRSKGADPSASSSSHYQSHARAAASNFLRLLEGHADERHRELQSMLLKAQPSLLPRCVAAVPWATDMEATSPLTAICALGHIAHLCRTADVDPTLRAAIRKSSARDQDKDKERERDRDGNKGADTRTDEALKATVDTLVSSLLPSALTKKDLTKLLQHPNALLQRSCLMLLHAVVKRIGRVLSEAWSGAGAGVDVARKRRQLEAALLAALAKHLPDFQSFVTIWKRLTKEGPSGTIVEKMDVAVEAVDVDVDGDEMTGGESEESRDAAKGDQLKEQKRSSMLALVLQVMESLVGAAPGVVSNFDLLRLLDEVISLKAPSMSTSSGCGEGQSFDSLELSLKLKCDSKTVSRTLRLLTKATSDKLCRWLGTREDAVKVATNVIVMPDWRASHKANALSKLLCLCATPSPSTTSAHALRPPGPEGLDVHVIDGQIRNQARHLLRLVLHQSGLFAGHLVANAVMCAEMCSWVDSLSLTADSVYVTEILLRMALHWNIEWCMQGDALMRQILNLSRDDGDESGDEVKVVKSARTTEAEGPAGNDAGSPTSPTVEYTAAPFSPVLLCALYFSHRNFAVLCESLPKHIRSHVQGDAYTDATATTFFAKYDSGFRTVLGPIITDVILSTAFSCASVDQYVHVLSHASDLIAPMAARDSGVSSSLAHMTSLLKKTRHLTSPVVLGGSEPPEDGKRKRSRSDKEKSVIAHDSQQLQGPGNLEELVIKLKRASNMPSSDAEDHRLAIVSPPVRLVPTVLDDMMEHVHMFVRQRMDLDTSTATESGGGCGIGGETSADVLRSVESVFDRLWMQVALLCVRNPDMCRDGDFLSWLGHKIAHELLPSTGRNRDAATHTSADAKSTVFAQVLHLLIALGDACNDQPSSDRLLSTQVLNQVENVFSQLIAVAVDVIHSVGCTATVAMILQADQVFDRYMSAGLVGKGLRQVLIAAATLYLNQMSRSKKRSGDLAAPFDPLSSLWSQIADRLLEDPNRIASADIGYFSLGWLVQRFLKKPELQRVFVNSMLDEVDGFDWFEAVANSATCGGHVSRAVVSSPGARVAAVNGMLVSILKSASSNALRTLSISSTRKGDEVGAVNIFEGVIFAMNHLEGTGMVNGWMTIANILDPLSLVAGFLSVEDRGGGAQEFVHHIFQNPHMLNQSPLLKLSLRLVFPSQAPSPHEVWTLSMLVVQLPGTVKFLGALGSKYILVGASTLQDAEKDLRKQWSLRRSESAGPEEWEQDARKAIRGGDCKTDERTQVAKHRAVEAVVDLMLLLHSQAQIASADALLVENLVALIVQSPANSRNDVVLGICAHVLMTSSLSWIVTNSRTKSAASKVEKMVELWVAAFEAVFDNICAFLNTVLGPSIAEDSESNIVAHLVQLRTLAAITVPVPHGGPKDGPLALLTNKLASTISSHQKKMNKLTKQLLKFTLDSEPILKAVVAMFAEVFPFGDKCTAWHNSFRPQPTDYYFPEMLLQMSVGHSKFRQVLSLEKSQIKSASGSTANSTLISFILILVGNIKAVTSPNEELKASCKYLVTALMTVYRGSMSQNDRMVLRILHLLHRLKLSIHPSMLRVNPGDARGADVFAGAKTKRVSAKGTSTVDSKGDGEVDTAIGLSWITSAVTATRAYATISHFPLWRSSIPQPLLIEGRAQEQLYRKHLAELDALYRDEWTNSRGDADGAPEEAEDETERESVATSGDDDDEAAAAADDDDHLSQGSDQSESHEQPHLAVSMGESSDESDDGGGDGDDDVAGDAGMNDSDEHMRVLVDLLGNCNDAVFDPCYWLPALCHVLHSEEISVRIVGNSGLLSIVLLSLSSTCPLIRSYATACLNKLLKMAKNQTQQRDAAFRERPQMILLMSFVRNAIAPPLALTDGKGKWKGSGEESFSSSAVTFPVTFSIFFARASMHLLQPTHELYGKMNKYLLSRPFCDVKDVPLYDLLVVDGEEAIHCLRMIRDGLSSHQDHLNLCRKNVYNRLMLQFPLMVKDHTNTAHAILDLLDKALSMRIASRYLIGRCNILSWLQQMASVTNSLHLTPHSSGGGLDGTHLHGSEGREDANEDAEGQPRRKGHLAAACLAAPPRMLTRVIVLLRRCVGAVFLLCGEGVLSKACIGDALGTVYMLLDELWCIMGESEVANQLPFDYFRQLCSLLWDVTIAQSSLCGRDPMAGELGLHRILRVSKLVIASIRKRRATMGENVGMAEVNEVVLSLLTLASFKLSTEPDGAPTGCDDSIGLAFRANLCAASLRIVVSVDGASSQQSLDGKDPAMKYFSIAPLNLISDVKTIRCPRECVSLMTLVQSLNPEVGMSNNEEPNFSAMLDRSWTALGAMAMESASSAPTVAPIVALGPQAVASVSALAMLRSLSSIHSHEPLRVETKEDDTKPMEHQMQGQGKGQSVHNLKQRIHMRGLQVEIGGAERDQINATTLRWCLLVHMTFGRCTGGNIYWRKKSSAVEVEACRIDKPSLRLLSLLDQGPPDVYSCSFLDFQLNLRLCVLALSSLVLVLGDEQEPNFENSVASTVTGLALKALSALLQVPVPYNASDVEASGSTNNLRRLEQIICAASTAGANSFDGLALWSGRAGAGAAGSRLGAAVELCGAMMGMVSLVVTCADKLVRADDDALTPSTPQASEREALSKSSMSMATAIVLGLADCDLGNIITEIDELATALETGTSHPLSRNNAAQHMTQGQALTSLFVDADGLFEPIGQSATSSTSCILFDDSRWRKGWKFGAEAVARAMKKELAQVPPRTAAVIDADTHFLADNDANEEENQLLADTEDRKGHEIEAASHHDEWPSLPPGGEDEDTREIMLPALEEGREKRKAPRLASHRPRPRKKLRSRA